MSVDKAFLEVLDHQFEALLRPIKRVSDAERTFNGLTREQQHYYADRYVAMKDDPNGYVMDALTDVKPDEIRAHLRAGDYTAVGLCVAREYLKYGVKFFEIEDEQ
jgi:hypothetical protein